MNWLKNWDMLLVVVGAINWGLVGVGKLVNANLDLVQMLTGWINPVVPTLVYVLVGIAGLMVLSKKG